LIVSITGIAGTQVTVLLGRYLWSLYLHTLTFVAAITTLPVTVLMGRHLFTFTFVAGKTGITGTSVTVLMGCCLLTFTFVAGKTGITGTPVTVLLGRVHYTGSSVLTRVLGTGVCRLRICRNYHYIQIESRTV
jgi:hypothetical protein